MKTFEIKVTQPLIGNYKGLLQIEANSVEEATELIKEMSNNEIDYLALWGHNVDYREGSAKVTLNWETLKNIDE